VEALSPEPGSRAPTEVDQCPPDRPPPAGPQVAVEATPIWPHQAWHPAEAAVGHVAFATLAKHENPFQVVYDRLHGHGIKAGHLWSGKPAQQSSPDIAPNPNCRLASARAGGANCLLFRCFPAQRERKRSRRTLPVPVWTCTKSRSKETPISSWPRWPATFSGSRGRAMLKALIEAEKDPAKLAISRSGSCRTRSPSWRKPWRDGSPSTIGSSCGCSGR
jgi:hypothetical protein